MKLKALFQIFIIVCSVFSVALLLQPNIVEAQEQQVCCEETLSGESCLYTEQSNCRPGVKQAATSCEQTSYCKLGCGFSRDTGRCFKNTPRSTCASEEGCQWADEPDCRIPQCERGCCVLSSECSFITQLECKRQTSLYEDVNMTFLEEINSELECTNQCRSFERGACVQDDGSCSFTTRAGCTTEQSVNQSASEVMVGFHPDRLCSNPQLGTECAPQQRTGCVPGQDGVYWFDSCGNPENIYDANKVRSFNNGFTLPKEQSCIINGFEDPNCGNCNFIEGTLCGQARREANPTFGDYTCNDLTCTELTIDQNTPAARSPGQKRQLGESWCAFDSLPGFGQEPVGSRHYRRLCINGQELTEPCKDFREEICVQGISGDPISATTEQTFSITGNDGFIEAVCRDNRWQGCADIDNQYDCENIQQRDCFWIGEQKEDEQAMQENKQGKCFPTVPPGLKFWPDESTGEVSSADATAVCEAGNDRCEVKFEKGGFGSDFECISNCECEDKEWLLGRNLLCKSLGDCGAYINILGKGTRGGFEVSPNHPFRIEQSDLLDFKTIVNPSEGEGAYDDFIGAFFSRTWPAFGIAFASGIVGLASGATGGFLGGLGSSFDTFRIFGGANFEQIAASNFVAPQVVTGEIAGGFIPTGQSFTLSGPVPETVATGVQNGVLGFKDGTYTVLKDSFRAPAGGGLQAAEGGTQVLAANPGATLLQSLNTLALLYTIYVLLDLILADTKEEEYVVTCNPWQAPLGGADCEQCSEDGKACSEYRCKSLGQLCELVNPGTENELCVNLNPNDANSPIIRADPDDLEPGFTLTEQPREGFVLNELVPPFTAVTLGFDTDEPAQCKYSIEQGKSFEEMTNFFGDALFDYNHTMTFGLPSALTEPQALALTNGGRYTLYTRCQDGSSNANNRDYYIRFQIETGPDLTPPVIELTSITNNAFVPANINETGLTIYLNEPADCRWDDVDTDFEQMQNSFACTNSQLPTSSIYFGLYDCTTLLTGVQQQTTNNYYFRCKDQPNAPEEQRNVNSESFVFTLRGTEDLFITSLEPSGELFTSSPTLRATTQGGAEQGAALCGYNFQTSNLLDAIEFLITNSTQHEQPFEDLNSGPYTAYVNCIDAAGNVATNSTSFIISVDVVGPQVAQLYTEGNILNLVTNEPSTCEFSATGTFTFGNGVRMTGENTLEHETALDSQIYYITCEDEFSNSASYVIYV